MFAWCLNCSKRSWFWRFHFVLPIVINLCLILISIVDQIKSLPTFDFDTMSWPVSPKDSTNRPHRSDRPPTNISDNEICVLNRRAVNGWMRFFVFVAFVPLSIDGNFSYHSDYLPDGRIFDFDHPHARNPNGSRLVRIPKRSVPRCQRRYRHYRLCHLCRLTRGYLMDRFINQNRIYIFRL